MKINESFGPQSCMTRSVFDAASQKFAALVAASSGIFRRACCPRAGSSLVKVDVVVDYSDKIARVLLPGRRRYGLDGIS